MVDQQVSEAKEKAEQTRKGQGERSKAKRVSGFPSAEREPWQNSFL